MKIAIIGTGNVGGTLAKKWIKAGHTIRLGVRDTRNFKGMEDFALEGLKAYEIKDAINGSEVILIATPASQAVEVTRSLGDTSGKIIIDSMNIVMGRGPKGYSNTSEAILDNTPSVDVVKCFNTTGFNNLQDPVYQGMSLDLFMAGDSLRGKKIAAQLAQEIGFDMCYDVGGNDKFELMEQFAWFWINLANFQGLGREFGFKLLKR